MGDEGSVVVSKARRVTGVGRHGEYLAGERSLCQRLQRSLCQRVQRQSFNGHGRSTERPYFNFAE